MSHMRGRDGAGRASTLLARLYRVGGRRIVAVAASVGLVATALAQTAGAAEIYPRPAASSFTVDGRGWGHGIGLSQYGAQGAAQSGKTWQQILDFYYPGTTATALGNPTVRVRVRGITGVVYADTEATGDVVAAWPGNTTGISLVSCAGTTAAPWRLLPGPRQVGTPTALLLQCRPSPTSDWLTYTSIPSTLAWFENTSTHLVTTYLGDASTMGTPVVYRGQVRAALIGAAGQETLTPVVALPMEDYLRSVVPSEMPASWQGAALAAQAVAARSYAEYHRRYAPVSAQWYDVYDDSRSQVFNGTRRGTVGYEYPSSDSAVSATADQALSYAGRVALTMFGSSNGGWTVDGGTSYLVAKADPWDALPYGSTHAWRRTLSVSSIEAAYPSIGSFMSLRVASRNGLGEWGGRVGSVVLTGSAGSVTVSGSAFQGAFGLRSSWFKPLGLGFPRDVTSDGDADLVSVENGSGALYAYPGDGSGGWRPRVVAASSGWGGYAKVFTAGRWDADAVSDVMYQTSTGDLYLASGNGDGTFAAGRKVGTGWQMHDTVFPVGDFDGDGLPDLLARRASDGALVLYDGDGSGGFTGARQVGWQWQGFTSIFSPGDFDGDGRPDVLARKADGTLWLYPGAGGGRFGAARQVGTGWQGFTWLVSDGDFDGDGNADVLACGADGRLWLYRGDGQGGWSGSRVVGSAWNTMSVVLP